MHCIWLLHLIDILFVIHIVSVNSLILPYQALGRLVIDNAAPVSAPVINDATWTNNLLTAQNEVICIAAGCHKMSYTDHLHLEMKMLLVKCHSEFIAEQYWLSCFQSHYPHHHLTSQPPPGSKMKGIPGLENGFKKPRFF